VLVGRFTLITNKQTNKDRGEHYLFARAALHFLFQIDMAGAGAPKFIAALARIPGANFVKNSSGPH
jgi:hypothetical protein